MRKKKHSLPPPFAAETKDSRHAGTFEVLIPVEGRNKPLRAPKQFDTLQAAEAWLHSPDGKDMIADLVEDEAKQRAK
jgi:antibiotic biosynthesis monooxygenase (ABM) superfamily enzyme